VPFLVAAVVVVTLLTLLNLILTFGVIRRLREHTTLLSRPPYLLAGDAEPMLPVGATVPQFVATATDGMPVSRGRRSGDTLVGFFSPGCRACDELLADFVGYATSMPGGSANVIAVVEALPGEEAEVVARLTPVARVVVERPGTAGLVTAFGVAHFPAVCVLDADGRVSASGRTLAALPVPARS
jgi:hypothetical protein